MTRTVLRKPVGFRLQAVADFYAGFIPGMGMARMPSSGSAAVQLTLAFRLDGSFAPVVVGLSESGEYLLLDIAGTPDVAAVEKQLGRVLGLDADTAAWFELGERDWVVGDLQRAFPGFSSVANASPYDAAIWAVLSPRMHQPQAARIKQALARELGDRLELAGATHYIFPSPERLSALDRFPGLTSEKIARLRGVGEAAQRGLLDATQLQALGEERALRELRSMRGIGPWAASYIYFRGVAPPDGLPIAEPRLLHGLASAYRLRSPSLQLFQRVASSWRPFRLWVCVLLMRHLGDLAQAERAPVWRPERSMVSIPN